MTARLAQLRVYPLKGARGIGLDRAMVQACGVAGDRRWLITGPDRRFLTQRELPALATLDAIPTPDGLALGFDGVPDCIVSEPPTATETAEVVVWRDRVLARAADAAAGAWLSARLGRPCRLWFMHDLRSRPVDPTFAQAGDHVSFADGFPLLAVNPASLDLLNDALLEAGHEPVPIERFRGNLVLSGLAPWAEDAWDRIDIGGMHFRAPKPCTRCVVITRDQRTGRTPAPGEPLRTLARLRPGVTFGVNLIPEAPGRLAVGDPVCPR